MIRFSMKDLLYWRQGFPNPDHEWVGRLLKNALGAKETVTMTVRHWKHFDWLSSQGEDMDLWVKSADIDRHRSEYKSSLSGELQVCLQNDEKRRYLSARPCPMFLDPDGYDGKFQEYEMPERLETDNEVFDRQLVSLLGVEVAVSMPGKYWRCFDWLADQGSDMEKWVIAADFARRERKRTLSAELMRSLAYHERSSYLNEVNVPLFISAGGYLNLDLRKDRPTPPDIKEREVVDSSGQKIPVKLHEKFWDHFDWLKEQGVDMVAWVKEADVSRFKGDLELTLRSEIMVNLQKDERDRYVNGEPCPLFIKPSGYGER